MKMFTRKLQKKMKMLLENFKKYAMITLGDNEGVYANQGRDNKYKDFCTVQ